MPDITNKMIIGTAGAVWFGASWVILKPNEIAAVYGIGGWKWYIAGPGPNFVPFGLASVKVFRTEGQQKEFPAEPDKIQKDDNIPLKPGEARAFRVGHVPYDQALYFSDDPAVKVDWEKGPTEKFEKLSETRRAAIQRDSLQDRINSEVTFVLTWHLQVRDDRGKKSRAIFDFIENVGTVDEAWRRLEDEAKSQIQTLLIKLTHGESLRTKAELSKSIQKKLQIAVGEGFEKLSKDQKEHHIEIYGKPWGITIDSFSLLEIHPGKRIAEAQANAVTAKSEAEATRTKADAEAYQIQAKGTATAKATLEVGTAEADVLQKKTAVYNTDAGKFAGQLEVASKLAEAGNVIVTSQQDGGLLGLVAAATRTADKAKSAA